MDARDARHAPEFEVEPMLQSDVHARAVTVVAALGMLVTVAARASADGTPPAATLGRAYPSFAAPADPMVGVERVPGESDPSGALRLRDALAAAMLRNPLLASFSWEVRAREARSLQAGLLPNPTAGAEVENVGGSGDRQGFESTETTVRLAQLVELGGKRARRRRLALVERDLAGWDYEAARLDVLTRTTKAFVAVLAAQERLALAERLRRVAGDSVRAAAAQAEIGAASPVETTRAEVALGRIDAERVREERELAAARTALAASWGGAARFDAVVGDLGGAVAPPPLDVVLARAEDNPDLARWATELEQRRAVLAVEEARRVPDVVVGVGGRHFSDNGDNALVFDVSVPLPVFNRNQGGILEARYRVARAAAERDLAGVTVRSALTAAYEDVQGAFAQLDVLDRRVLPKAEAAFRGATDAYQRGLFRFLEVLDAQRTLFELRGERIDLLAKYRRGIADVERLSGAPLDEAADEGGDAR